MIRDAEGETMSTKLPWATAVDEQVAYELDAVALGQDKTAALEIRQ